MRYDLRNIFGHFLTDESYISGEPFGPGHIHDTFLITTGGRDNYILQRINNNIFGDIPALQGNIVRVTSHIRAKLIKAGETDIKRKCLTPVPARDNGLTWFNDGDGNYWRMFVFIPDHVSYETVDSEENAFEGGRIVGGFMAMLSDLPGEPLHETIPRFHDIRSRLEAFHRSVAGNLAGRTHNIKREIDSIMKREDEMQIILRLGEEGKIPLRITHNDTKFNNILFSNEGKALCLIDLDTVMPGYVHYDFGDAIRTATNRAKEDSTDLSSVSVNLGIFEGYARGFVFGSGTTLNDYEKEYLAFAPKLMTYVMATRFLTDYIDGDTYYKTSYPEHNLQRTRVQLTLLNDMERNYDQMKNIIKKLLK